ncbi:carboxylesterase/lipase family protein [Streptacidiphilus jiangxiensis]|uniref:carboxylesterase/lipase family protein n=1 Tax=Streptacidiphilus jiangxiensis TaxID=235985 RepID=UPI0005AA0309|nr:carboxylesterase/lipase family protein [Streptacidiphilus jiangxiensis]
MTISSGRIRGEHDGRVEVFRGIPYAAAPTGSHRFRPPARAATWSGVRDARAYGPAAPQNPDPVLEQMFGLPPSAHDETSCLTVNVWTPQSGSGRRPVLVWIHGGGFLTGAGSDPVFDGGRLVQQHDVVLVTVNYRLGAFGFLHLAEVLGHRYASSGNTGLLDQRAALAWVRDNIATFGGDPRNVTLFGQSAGAFSVVAHLASPGSAGLFHKAIVQSGSGEGAATVDRAGEVTRAFLDELGIAPRAAADLLTRPTADLLRAQETVTRAWQARGDGVGLAFLPLVDGTVLPRTPVDAIGAGAARGVPLLLGSNRDEGRMFTVLGPGSVGDLPEDALVAVFAAHHADPGRALDAYRSVQADASPAGLLGALIGERLFGGPTRRLAEAQAAGGGAVWRYRFDWSSSAHGGRLGACHSLELPFVFDNLDVAGVDRFTGPRPPQELADVMSRCWAGFARTGDPGLWPAYEPEGRHVMLFDRVTAVAKDPDRTLRLLGP